MIRKLQVLLERWLFEGEPNCFPCLYQEEPLEQTFGCLSLICYMAWCHLTQGIMGDVEKKRWCWCCTELQYLEAKRDLQPSELTDFMRMWSTSERLDWWRRSWSLQELLAQTVSGLWPFPKWEQLAKNEVVLIRVSPQCETWTCTPYWWKSAALEDPNPSDYSRSPFKRSSGSAVEELKVQGEKQLKLCAADELTLVPALKRLRHCAADQMKVLCECVGEPYETKAWFLPAEGPHLQLHCCQEPPVPLWEKLRAHTSNLSSAEDELSVMSRDVRHWWRPLLFTPTAHLTI